MSRSGYTDDYCSENNYGYLYRSIVNRSVSGKRGQAFLQELAREMDAMPEKKLIAGDLVTPAGEVCAIGVVCKARGLSTKGVDIEDPEAVGKLVGISRSLAAEIEFMNDDDHGYFADRETTPEQRWSRMRAWVAKCIETGVA
jgi:hypothetical protein